MQNNKRTVTVMKNNEVKKLKNLGFDSEQIEVYQVLLCTYRRKGYSLEQAEILAIYTIQRAEVITDLLFDKDF